MAKDMK